MNESPIRLLAIDLDGTLLNDAKQIGARTLSGLHAACRQGIKVVITSARPPRSVRHIFASLGLDTWQINYNGAMIWDEVRREVVFHQPIAGDVARRMIELARQMFPEVLASCEVKDRWLTDRHEQHHTTETGRLFKPDRIASVAEICAEPVTKLLLLGPPAMMSLLAPALQRAEPGVALVRSDPDLIQIMDGGVNKGVALRRVADHYQTPMDQVMAIGDAANDIPMLKTAGVAVAMGNASVEVKQIAHWVAPSNNDEGVHAAMVRYAVIESTGK